MVQDFEIQGSKINRVVAGAILWVTGIYSVLVILVYLFPGDNPPLPLSSFLIALTVNVIIMGVFFLMWDLTHRTITLHGKQLSLRQGRVITSSWDIDIDNIVGVRGGMGGRRGFGNASAPYLAIKLSDGQVERLYMLMISQSQKARLLPLIVELINRPNVTMAGYDLKRVLKTWFGHNAPEITKPVADS